jgi:hypothetical protein
MNLQSQCGLEGLNLLSSTSGGLAALGASTVSGAAAAAKALGAERLSSSAANLLGNGGSSSNSSSNEDLLAELTAAAVSGKLDANTIASLSSSPHSAHTHDGVTVSPTPKIHQQLSASGPGSSILKC